MKHCLVAAVTIEVDTESRLLPSFVPVPRKDAITVLNAIQEAMAVCADRGLLQIVGSRITWIEADRGGEFNNPKLRDDCDDKEIVLTFSPAHQPSSNRKADRIVGLLKTTVKRMLKQAHLDRPWWSHACRTAGRMMRARVLGRPWNWPLFGQHVGIWTGKDKDQAKSF